SGRGPVVAVVAADRRVGGSAGRRLSRTPRECRIGGRSMQKKPSRSRHAAGKPAKKKSRRDYELQQTPRVNYQVDLESERRPPTDDAGILLTNLRLDLG